MATSSGDHPTQAPASWDPGHPDEPLCPQPLHCYGGLGSPTTGTRGGDPQGAQPTTSLSRLRRLGHDGAGGRHPESHGWLSPSCDWQGWTGLPDKTHESSFHRDVPLSAASGLSPCVSCYSSTSPSGPARGGGTENGGCFAGQPWSCSWTARGPRGLQAERDRTGRVQPATRVQGSSHRSLYRVMSRQRVTTSLCGQRD